MQLNAKLHLATDWQDYAKHMLAVLGAHPRFTNQPEVKLKRPPTKFEQRGLRLGHEVYDFVFTKTN